MARSDQLGSSVTHDGGAAPVLAPSRRRSELESVFCAQLPHIDAVARFVARRNGFRPDDCPDVVAWVRLKFVEGDYGLIAKHRGESSLESYLAVVVARLVRDYRMMVWGRWRPSSLALRHGSLAIRLEVLTRRDRLSYDEALNVLRSEGCTLTDQQLRQLFRMLPERSSLRPREIGTDDPALEHALSAPPEVEGPASSLNESSHARVFETVEREIGSLAAEDQLILRLRYREGLSIADVARALGLAEKPLYRRLPTIVRRARERIEAAGITRRDVEEMFADG